MSQVKENQNRNKKRFTITFLFFEKLLRNIITSLFVISIFLFCLYIIGNYQSFTDKSQLLILSVLSICSIILGTMSFLGIIQNIVFMFFKNKKTTSFFTIIFYIITLIVAFAFIFYTTVINRLAKGI